MRESGQKEEILTDFENQKPKTKKVIINPMHTFIAASFFFLAQVDPNSAIGIFKSLLAKILLLIGIGLIGYGGYLLSKTGHVMDAFLCIIGGFLCALAVPFISYCAHISGVDF